MFEQGGTVIDMMFAGTSNENYEATVRDHMDAFNGWDVSRRKESCLKVQIQI